VTDHTVIANRSDYLAAVESIASGVGPIAVDAERASGFRYSQRAYLIQIFRRDAGTFLFDPPAVGRFDELNDAIADEEWVLHAATQDLTCLREVGLDPHKIFDTELAARLLGMPRVGLGTVVEELLGVHLAKEHSAADWSTRPLPSPGSSMPRSMSSSSPTSGMRSTPSSSRPASPRSRGRSSATS